MSGIAAMGAVIAVSLLFAIFRGLHAGRIQELRAKHDFVALREKYHVLHTVISLGWVLIALAGGIFGGAYVGRLTYALAERYLWRTPETQFLINPSWGLMYFAVGMLCFIASALIGSVTLQLVLGSEKVNELKTYDSLKSGFDNDRFAVGIIVVVVAPALLMLGMSLDNFIRCEPDVIVVDPFWTFGRTEYAMADVAHIEVTFVPRKMSDGTREIPHYQVRFKDGNTWATQGPPAVEVNPQALAEHGKLMQYISEQSGKPIEIVELPPK